jgi:protein SCO1/2
MAMKRTSFVLVLVLVLAATLGLGCHREAPPGAAPTTARDYRLTGKVLKIAKESRQVTIRHAEIPGVMGAMAMPFTLKDPAVFDDLRVGDEVEGTLRVVWAGTQIVDHELRDLVVSKPALGESPGSSLASGLPRRLEPGESVPDFVMTTEEGTKQALSSLRGHVVVLTFIYTRCPLPDFCPLMDRKFAALATAIDAFPGRARQVRLISLSFDPEHDTPEVLKKHAQVQGAKPPLWTFAVASHDELARIAPVLGLSYGPTATEIIHNLSTAVIAPDGTLVRLLVGTQANSWQTTDLLKDIYPLLIPAGERGQGTKDKGPD